MLPPSNVKLMDTIVFVSALVFGLGESVSVGALTWLVYVSVNPLGAAGWSLLIIFMVSETVYAFLGCFEYDNNANNAGRRATHACSRDPAPDSPLHVGARSQ